MLKDALIYLYSLFTQTPDVQRLDSHDLDYLVVPEASKYFDLDKYREKPRRIEQKVQFTTLNAFIFYVNRWAKDETFVSCDRSNQIYATIDYHNHNLATAAWCEHVATLLALVTPEWKVWTGGEKQRMEQRQFVNFLEDNAEDIKTDLGKLLSSVKEVTIGQTGSTKSRVSATENDLAAHKNVTVASGLPDIIELGLRPWQYSETYLVKARPFIHFEEGKQPEFSYHLVNTEKVKEVAFEKAAALIEAQTLIRVLV